MHDEFTFSLDKFESREKHLNGELHSLLMEYKQVATELSGIQVAHKRIIDESHKSRMDLQAIITENDSKKAEMEQLGQMMSDSSKCPYVFLIITLLLSCMLHHACFS